MPEEAHEIALSPLAIEDEEWRPIEWTDGIYEVSSNGRVRRTIDRYGNHCASMLKPIFGSIVYPTVHFSLQGKRKRVTIHRLVAEAFLPNPDNLPQVNHKDENPANNRADNLEWCTELYNHNYGTLRERLMRRHGNPIIFKGVRYHSIHDCSRKTGCTRKTISKRCVRLGTIRKSVTGLRAIPVIFKGVAYSSIGDCARQSGVDRRRIKKYGERINQ